MALKSTRYDRILQDPRIVVNFVTALPSEARPLVDYFRLRRRTDVEGITLYERDHIRLAVSGIGKLASAAAVGYMAGSAPHGSRSVWVNVGIAGHGTLPKGTVAMAHQIEDRATRRVYYPAIPFAAPCATYPLTCFDHPTASYDGDALCDMESSGFYAAATRHSSVEFAHCLKVVSDNSATDLQAIERNGVTRSIAAHMDTVEKLTEALMRLGAQTFPESRAIDYAVLLDRWHFSVTQQRQLHELARRWGVRRPNTPWPLAELAGSRDAAGVLQIIRNTLDSVSAGDASPDPS